MKGPEAAHQSRNPIERLGAMIPVLSGYLERGMLREVDKLERDHLAGLIDRARGTLQRKIQDATRAGALAGLDTAASLDKLLDRYANRIRHADYGASGLFDAIKIGQPQLEALYSFDVALIEKVTALGAAIDGLAIAPGSIPDAGAWRALLAAAETADHDFDRRETVYHDVIQGGR